ncbi:hypothetical protein AAFF_G00080180 [Aldrovandia affinis]|uniref:Uncharacterized protein n=1 Tax=Aldrovandia affinis TaxID=143900 RepID=A0AAD7T4W3_9TELE|nr:hypothetical protein AAFF_G00080180 [Aldrovandia affinis]
MQCSSDCPDHSYAYQTSKFPNIKRKKIWEPCSNQITTNAIYSSAPSPILFSTKASFTISKQTVFEDHGISTALQTTLSSGLH